MKFEISAKALEDMRKLTLKPLPGESLLESIRKTGTFVPAPCGGRGICGKCTVEIEGEGRVKACSCYPKGDTTVWIAEPSPMQVLTESFWPDPEPRYDGESSENERFLGFGVDLGTTTVVVFMDDLRDHRNLAVTSFPNPQSAFGADVISRIQYCSDSSEGTETLHGEIIGAIERAISGMMAEKGIEPQLAANMTVAGNPTMLHLFRGDNPASLAQYPFTPVFLDEQQCSGGDIGFVSLHHLKITILPSVSAYIGSDIVAGLAAVSLNSPSGWSLFLDIGTNGEMALWKDNHILACATAAGPAFEGARISCGMAGVEGAVSAVNTDGFETIGNKPATGVCGSGLVDAVAQLLDAGNVDIMGFMEQDTPFIPGIALKLTPQDIREVQLAKGAIAAGIKVLLLEAGITASDVDRVFMAGGFGYALHDWSAGRIGLIPDGLDKKQIRAGNTSGLGARLWLHSDDFRRFTRELAGRVRYIGLSDHPDFNDLFMWEMMFPASGK